MKYEYDWYLAREIFIDPLFDHDSGKLEGNDNETIQPFLLHYHIR